ncbi:MULTISPECIES: ester cyclase [Bradyrhizobium]|uniref:ester cyclase n=1 Tax=Bradyrhizobium nanningense TaxID=1325118 RepID=UPI001008901C
MDPRSGKPVCIHVIDICRFDNGKLVEHWGVPDRLHYCTKSEHFRRHRDNWFLAI